MDPVVLRVRCLNSARTSSEPPALKRNEGTWQSFYPDEPTTIQAYQDRVRAEYLAVGRIFPDPNDPDAYRHFTRYGYSCRSMPEPEAATKHIRELHAELNPSQPEPGQPTVRPLVGRLRVANKLLHDETGPRRVFCCSWFPALRIRRDTPQEFERQLDAIAAAAIRVSAAILCRHTTHQ